MKKLLLVAAISLISICNVISQEKMTEKQQLVQKVIIDLFQAFSDRDTDKLISSCTPEVVVLENGIVWNLDTLTKKNNQNKAIGLGHEYANDFSTLLDKYLIWMLE